MYNYNFNKYFKFVSKKFYKKVALIDVDDKKYTYKFLDKKSDIFASFIFKYKSKKKNHVIAIDSKKNVNTIIAFLGCLKIGVPYFFLDLSLPNDRIKKILKKTNCKILISENNKNINFKKIISVKKIIKSYSECSFTECVSDVPAYVMFTSGSTGEPKGAIISHQSVINFVKWSKSSFNISSKDIFSQLNPLYFDNSVFDLYNSFLNGATLVLTNGLDIDNPNKLLERLKKNKCSIWFSTPSLIIYYLSLNLISKKKFKYLKKIIFGGEGFPKDKLRELTRKAGKKFYYNVYGPTECTCICSRHLITKDDFSFKKNKETYVTIGQIADNFDYSIVNDKNKDVKPGEIGELILFGPNVSHGYIGDLDSTKKNFIHFNNDNYQIRGYRTGDLVYYKVKENTIYFIGRKDTQIKHMGYRIELNELEVTLNKHKMINEACVFYKKDISEIYGKIVAIVSIKNKIEKQDILNFIKKFLPRYFLPHYLFFVDQLPKNSNNKIDRKLIKTIYEKKIRGN